MAAKPKPNTRDPRTLHTHMWYLHDALPLVRLLQEALWPLQYHVTLGGSVLNNGYADKDVDIFVLPFNNVTPFSPASLHDALESVLTYVQPIGFPTPDAAGNYPPSQEVHLRKDQWSFEGKRVDVFVVKLQKEAPASGPAADSKES